MWEIEWLVTFCSLCVALVTSSYSADVSVIDLTYELGENTLLFPGSPTFNFTILERGYTPQGYWLEMNSFATPEHGGTHFDAPSHFVKGQWRAHQIPADRLVGPGVVIDVRDSVSTNPDYTVSISDVLEWEKRYGAIPDGAIVLMLSGWSERYPDPNLVYNTNNVTDQSTWHFPGFQVETVRWLIQNKNIKVLGVDAPSTDFGQRDFPEVHVALGKANVLGISSVNNLEKVPPFGATIFVGALKLYEGSGGPVRLLAVVNKPDIPSCTCPTSDYQGRESSSYY